MDERHLQGGVNEASDKSIPNDPLIAGRGGAILTNPAAALSFHPGLECGVQGLSWGRTNLCPLLTPQACKPVSAAPVNK